MLIRLDDRRLSTTSKMQGNCFESNTDYDSGVDFWLTGVDSEYKCQDFCKKEPLCNYFTYIKRSSAKQQRGDCWLIAGVKGEKTIEKDRISGEKNCRNIPRVETDKSHKHQLK